MSDDVIPPPEPDEVEPHPESAGAGPDQATPSGPHTDPEQLREDVAALSELAAAGVEIHGEVQVTESTWVVYGHTSYDGEVIVGEYHDEIEALEVLRATAPAPLPDDDRSVP